jgi:hypothetical protein
VQEVEMKKLRVEILRGKLARLNVKGTISSDMPEEVAAGFLAEMRLCPDCAAAAAVHWCPDGKRTKGLIALDRRTHRGDLVN